MSVIAHNLGAIGAGLGTTLVIALLAYAGALLAGTPAISRPCAS